ncbi:hypothetical protein F5888DRAFT_916359 [Russula emetica]|nr:hypothetical protein F5888DRAFT_916359 [Russula emetica]
MVNLHSSLLSEEASVALVRLWHVMSGIYCWEFFTTLDYEWRVFRGRLPCRYTIWIYSLTRVACLLGVIVCTVGMDVSTSYNCQLWVSSVATLFCVTLAAASLLIVLRIIAIWNRHKVIMATSIIIWGTGVALHINTTVRVRSTWNPLVAKCLSITTENSVLLGLAPSFFADLVLILIMLVGLLLLRRHGGGTLGLTPILWRQGVVWLSLAIVSGTPPAVIAVLSKSGQFTDIVLTPGVIAMTIAATRLHRSLVDYASGFPDVVSARENINLPMSSAVSSNIKRAQAALDSSDRIEVTVHTAFEQHTTTQTNDYDSYNSTPKEQVHEKPNAAWGLDNDAERGM